MVVEKVSLSQQFLENLLYEDEGVSLDFKREQYPFEGVTKDEKSELLKDILAFANAWRRANAYILIGVEDIRGGRSLVHGVNYHLDDAKLQQFVNSKTQRPVNFSYIESKLDGLDVGIISIPPQVRPLYLKDKYGKLEKNTVYIRRGSSTDIASPEEIAKMGQVLNREDAIPLLKVEFFDETNFKSLGNYIQAKTTNLKIPREQEIPDYGVKQFSIGNNLYHTMPNITANKDYYREAALYLKKMYEHSQVDFLVVNEGTIVAKDVRIEIFIEDLDKKLLICDATDIPGAPSKESFLLSQSMHTVDPNPDVWVDHIHKGWRINGELGKIQPKAAANTISSLYIGSKESVELTMTVKVFADNLPSPKNFDLSIDINTEDKSLTVEGLINLIHEVFRSNN